MKAFTEHLKLRTMRRVRDAVGRVVTEDIQFATASGYRIAATLTLPEGGTEVPAAVLCPGGNRDRQDFRDREPIRPEEVAGLGCAALTFDPTGRGSSWGPEDYGGLEHHDAAASAVRWARNHPAIRSSGVGLVGLELGSATAIGAARVLAEQGVPAAWVLDWEGPSDRHDITRDGSNLAPALGHPISDDTFWFPREGVHHVGQIRCPYWRLQADPDHARSRDLRHAIRMMDAATNLQWYRLNFHTAGQVPGLPTWLRAGQYRANQALLRAIGELSRGR